MNALALATVDTFRNTIYHGDAFTLLRSLPAASVDMILTDMPYGTTACSWDTMIDLDAWWAEAHRVAKPRAAIVCTGSQPFTSRLVMSNPSRFRYEWVWGKSNGTNFNAANIAPMKRHENILVFSDGFISPGHDQNMAYYPQGLIPRKAVNSRASRGAAFGERPNQKNVYIQEFTNYPKSILYFDYDAVKFHPTQKPVALFEYLIRTYTQPGDLVLDPFVGSGTTALAARACGRDYICGDSDAGYVASARDRLRLPFEPRQVKQETRLDDLPLFAGLEESA